MDWLEMYRDDLQAIFEGAECRMAQFPQPLNEKGLEYAAGFHPFLETGKKNHICYLLPLWLGDLTGLDKALLRKLSMANVFAMLYFFLQDDMMDSPGIRSKHQVPLANLFYMESLRLYREMYPAESPFWNYMEQYIREWSDSVTNEGVHNYFMKDMSLIARKASPVKLGSTGALLLAGQESLIPSISEQVDAALVALQMADDWSDWQEDLAEGSYNGLLAMVQDRDSAPPTAQSVKRQLYLEGLLEQYARAAAEHRSKALTAATPIPHLDAFHQSLVDKLRSEAERLKQEKLALLQGGMSYILSNPDIFS
jgi:hypothetical protein